MNKNAQNGTKFQSISFLLLQVSCSPGFGGGLVEAMWVVPPCHPSQYTHSHNASQFSYLYLQSLIQYTHSHNALQFSYLYLHSLILTQNLLFPVKFSPFLAPQSGALRISAYGDFQSQPIHPLIAFEHLSLSMVI